jgi:two-component system NtrC family sensor kinase
VEVNSALANMLGYEATELCGKNFVELTHPQDRAESIKAVELLRSGNPVGRVEKRYLKKDGSVLWADVNLAALRNAEGEITNFVVHIMDISERKRIEAKLARDEQALRNSERFARSTVDALSAHIAILDESGTIITVNGAWRAFALANPPVSANVNEGANYFAVCDTAVGHDSEGAAAFAAGIRSVLRGEMDIFEQEYPCSSPQEVRWFLGRVTRFPEAGDCRAVVAHVDITKRKLAEEETKKAASFLHTLLNAIPIPIFHKGKDGRYIGANRAFGEFFGLALDDVIGKTVFGIVPPEHARYYNSKDEELYARPGVQVYSAEAKNALGELREVIFHKATFDDASGQPSGIIGAILDVTDRKRAEAELSHARKLEAVGQLAAGIAHEINTPAQYVGDGIYFMKEAFESYKPLIEIYRSATKALEQMGANIDLVRAARELESEIDLEYILANVPGSFDRCIDGISRISNIVRAMKEFSHPDQREKSSADLNLALQNTLIIAHNEYKYVANVETRLGSIPPVLCHLGDLNQVFLNLIVNAAHAIGEVIDRETNKGLIRISTLQEGDYVRIDISDNGGGIPEEIRERIFEPFFTTKPVGKGTGQGLAIARSIIVDKHSGMLTFESEVGFGTTFRIRLPLGGKTSVFGEDSP